MPEVVAILGASKDKSRYAYKAQIALIDNAHTVVPINPKYDMLNGIRCYPNLASYSHKIDTVTAYVRAAILSSLVNDIIQASPDRVILNPGTEDSKVIEKLQTAGIQVEAACTLVLLRTSQF
jgi:predicted CoA-binding protein